MSDDLVKRAREFCIHTPLSKAMITKLADRIEELEAKLAKAVDEVYNYDKAPTDPHHGGKLMQHQMQRRIEELEEELLETRMSELLALGQAQEAYEQQLAVETRLTKAVWLAEQECPFGYGTGSYNDWWHERRKTLAELKGSNNA